MASLLVIIMIYTILFCVLIMLNGIHYIHTFFILSAREKSTQKGTEKLDIKGDILIINIYIFFPPFFNFCCGIKVFWNAVRRQGSPCCVCGCFCSLFYSIFFCLFVSFLHRSCHKHEIQGHACI